MSNLFHLPLMIFWASACTGNSLSFELSAAVAYLRSAVAEI